jgi:hypothetical protein
MFARYRFPIRVALAAFICVAVATVSAMARPRLDGPQPSRGGETILGGPATAAKAVVDTVLLMGPAGSGAAFIGTFEDGAGQPDWNGWTHRDLTAPMGEGWHVDTYNVVSGQYSAWCGDAMFPACNGIDQAGGYGNSYRADLEWRGQVDDPAAACTVDIAAVANIDVEVDYDYVSIVAESAGGEIVLFVEDGIHVGLPIAVSHVYQPGDYVGAGGDEVAIRFRVVSDASYSDEDCLYPTSGAIQLDDVVIDLSNGQGMAHDFEDGTLGPLVKLPQPAAGDFSSIWAGLEDADACRTNYSPQAAFIDDGLVVPGTGGSYCIDWCYGPSGYVVNSTGGLLGGDVQVMNTVVSPVIPWPAGVDGATLDFDVFVHENFGYMSPGIFYTWDVRSAAGSDPAAIETAPWRDRGYVYFGGPEYRRDSYEVSDLLVDQPGFVQVSLGVWHYGPDIFFDGHNATPAPYFDNVRLRAYELQGPVMSARHIELAIDGFPAAGPFDENNPAAASVRFDMARSSAANDQPRIAGDSVVVTVVPVRSGAVLAGPPALHYRLKRNAQFDAWRSSGLPDEGSVACQPVAGSPDKYSADLPDEGFLFPGDVLHYFFAASDIAGGVERMSLLPADTTGFADFHDPAAYDEIFAMRALPSAQYGFNVPPRLLWIEAGADGEWDGWMGVLDALCADVGYDFDVFLDRGLGMGLGAAATAADLAVYKTIYYAAGDLVQTIEDGDGLGTGDTAEVDMLEAWFQLGEKNMFLCGDNIAYGAQSLPGLASLLSSRFGAVYSYQDIRPLINNQAAPVVESVHGSFVTLPDRWIADGGCPTIREFDGVGVVGSGARLAEFTDPSGDTGAYSFAALTYAEEPISAGEGILMPYDLLRVDAVPGDGFYSDAHLRAALVLDIDMAFEPWFWPADGIGCVGGVGDGDGGDGVPPVRFGATASPNPFNPKVSIAYSVARPGRLSVAIYDIRGRLVRNLMNAPVEAAGSVDWDGRDDSGGAAASGVYFYEVRMDNDVQVGKLALIR